MDFGTGEGAKMGSKSLAFVAFVAFQVESYKFLFKEDQLFSFPAEQLQQLQKLHLRRFRSRRYSFFPN